MLKSISLRKFIAGTALAGAVLLGSSERSEAGIVPAGEPFGPGSSFTVLLNSPPGQDLAQSIALAGPGLGLIAQYLTGNGVCPSGCNITLTDGTQSDAASGVGQNAQGTLSLANIIGSSVALILTGDNPKVVSAQVTVTPLPAAAALFGTALVGLGWVRRRRNRAAAT